MHAIEEACKANEDIAHQRQVIVREIVELPTKEASSSGTRQRSGGDRTCYDSSKCNIIPRFTSFAADAGRTSSHSRDLPYSRRVLGEEPRQERFARYRRVITAAKTLTAHVRANVEDGRLVLVVE